MIERTHKTSGELVPTCSVARYSDCEAYRYYLKRTWDLTLPLVNYLMLNPSTATEEQNDPTLARCQERAERLGYGGFAVTNLFAYRATDPRDMKRQADPVGRDNDKQVLAAAGECSLIVCAWGANGSLHGRAREVIAMLEDYHDKLHYLRLTKNGAYEHPLYVPYSQRPIKMFSRKAQCTTN
jgi:hypothetical protein